MDPRKSQGIVERSDLSQAKSVLLDALGALHARCEERVNLIAEHLEAAARTRAGMRTVFEHAWRPRLESVRNQLVDFRRRIAVRPTVCVMGKRGQGKTSLLQTWLGGEDSAEGLREIKSLPTGAQDTTAALIRLTACPSDLDQGANDALHVEFLGEGDLTTVKDRPDGPRRPNMKLSRAVRDDGVDADAAFRVCRFPIPAKDDGLRLKQQDGLFYVAREGSETLTGAQWNAKEVTIPVVLGETQGRSRAVIGVMDVIDAPGADAQAVPPHPEWKREKNAYVFQIAVHYLDVLLVVCASDNRFAELYPVVRGYVATRCFGRVIDLDDVGMRSHLSRLELQEGIAKYLARKIAELTLERREIEFEKANFRLSETTPFSWRRNLPPLEAKKTVFNYVATYNDFERRFAEFMDRPNNDVLRFASLGTTEQGESGSQFRVDYIKPSGAIGFYHPDWVVVQKVGKGEVNWIIETKGRVWEGTTAKDEAIDEWCRRVTAETGVPWRYRRVNQTEFDGASARNLADLINLVQD